MFISLRRVNPAGVRTPLLVKKKYMENVLKYAQYSQDVCHSSGTQASDRQHKCGGGGGPQLHLTDEHFMFWEIFEDYMSRFQNTLI